MPPSETGHHFGLPYLITDGSMAGPERSTRVPALFHHLKLHLTGASRIQKQQAALFIPKSVVPKQLQECRIMP